MTAAGIPPTWVRYLVSASARDELAALRMLLSDRANEAQLGRGRAVLEVLLRALEFDLARYERAGEVGR